MLLWFAALSAVVVWAVFQSPAVDYRMVMLGSILPVLEVVDGSMWFAHTLLAPVGMLALVMGATVRRRLVRRRWLGVPIGLFLHLVLDGSFAEADTFWWPFSGASLGEHRLPELSHGGLVVAMEVVGAAVAVWAYRRFGLEDPGRRAVFLRTGQLDRALARGGTQSGDVERGC